MPACPRDNLAVQPIVEFVMVVDLREAVSRRSEPHALAAGAEIQVNLDRTRTS